MLWKTSFRNLIRKKSRSFFTLLAIFIGISTMFAVLSTVETGKTLTNERLKLYLGNADYSILTTDTTFSDEVLQTVKHKDGIDDALGLIHRQLSIELEGENRAAESRLRLTGLSSLDNELLSLKVVSGNINNDGIIIPISTARLWGINDGETLSLMFPSGKKNIKIAAIVEDTPLLEGPANWEEATNKNWRALATLKQTQNWFNENGQIQEIRLKFNHSMDSNKILDSLRKDIHDESLYFQKVVLDEKQTNQLDDLYFMLYAIGGLAMFIAAFILYNTLYVSVTERKGEIAIMKTIGYTPSQIRTLFLAEVTILAILGIILGLPIGILLASFLQESLFSAFQANLDFVMQYKFALPASILLGLLIPLLASIIPVNYASRVDVISSLKSITKPSKKRSNKRLLLGLIALIGGFIPHIVSIVFLFIAVVLLSPTIMWLLTKLFQKMRILGYEGQIAANNVNRTLNRSANMSLILALAICIGLLVSSIFSSLEKNVKMDVSRSFGGDIQFSSDKPLTKGKINLLSKVEGVEAITTYNEKKVTWMAGSENREFTIISADPKWYENEPLFYSAHPSNKELLNQLKTTGGILLGDYAFREWGGKVGDPMTIIYNGSKIKMKVIGKVNTAQYGGYTVFLSNETFTQYFQNVKPLKGLIKLSGTSDGKIVKNAILDSFPFTISTIQTLDEEIEKQQRALPGVKSIFDSLLLIAIIVAGIGILNTLTMNVMDRLREIGVMRAVAFTSQQIYRTIIGEGLIIGLNGMVIGIFLGIFTIFLNARETTDTLIEFIVPINTLTFSIIGGIMISIAASFLPANRATKIKLIEALKQE